MLRRVSIALALVVTALPVSAFAGEIEVSFARKMSRGGLGVQHAAIVWMKNHVDVEALHVRLVDMNATRQFRHQLVCTELMAMAKSEQASLIAMLEQAEKNGAASDINPMWLINAVLVKATPAVLRQVAQRGEVGIVYDGSWPVEIIEPVQQGPITQGGAIAATEPGIVDIKAPDLWAMGITGKGILVSNIDTGVFMHQDLSASWRGNDPGVSRAEAWHDPYSNFATPRDLNGHGTHTMGTICGQNGIGVAHGAKWIASGTIDRGGGIPTTVTNALLAFQWCADPDKNPATVTDVPHVCSNSWGLSPLFSSHGVSRCDNTFWTVIDNCERSGCAVVYAAGNEGTRGGSSGSLRTPADRIGSPVNVFAVAALGTTSTVLASFSSRGPSGCDNQTIKPDVSARGQSVRSASNRGVASYRSLSGTSMACPHVAGGLALLAQVWPEATPDQLKSSILNTCDDRGAVGDDNSFGMGIVNLLSARLDLLSRRPVVSVGVQGTKVQYKEGEFVHAGAVIANNTNTSQTFQIYLGWYFDGNPTSLIVVPPVDITLPANFNNRAVPIPLKMPIPTGLPGSVHAPKVWSIVAEVRVAGGGALIHRAQYDYTIIP